MTAAKGVNRVTKKGGCKEGLKKVDVREVSKKVDVRGIRCMGTPYQCECLYIIMQIDALISCLQYILWCHTCITIAKGVKGDLKKRWM